MLQSACFKVLSDTQWRNYRALFAVTENVIILASSFTRSIEASAKKAAEKLSSSIAEMILAVSTSDFRAVSTFVTQTFRALEIEVRAMARRQAAPAVK